MNVNEDQEDLKILETVLLVLTSISILAVFIPSFAQGTTFLEVMLSILGLFYGITGFWYFKNERITKIQAVVIGIILGYSLYILSSAIDLYIVLSMKILFIPHTLLVAVLSYYLWKNRDNIALKSKYWRIYKRALIIFGFTNLFLFTPITFKPFRKLVIYMYQGNSHFGKNNLEAYDYKLDADDALNEGHCDDAIFYAEKSNRAGLDWKGIESMEEYNKNDRNNSHFITALKETGISEQELKQVIESKPMVFNNRLMEIEGTFEVLFDAYYCKAEQYRQDKSIENAIIYYNKAYKVSKDFDVDTKYWNRRETKVIERLAESYTKIGNYVKADSLHSKIN